MKLTSDYSKFAGYKINLQKTIAFLYASNKQLEFEIKITVQFKLASKYEILINLKSKYKSKKIFISSIWGELWNSDRRNFKRT